MTDQRELDRLLGAFFVEGTNELADRVIDAALDQIDHTQQRRVLRMPRRFPTMNIATRLATAAVISVLAVGGTIYLLGYGRSDIGGPSQTPGVTSSASQTAGPSTVPSLQPKGSWTITGAMVNEHNAHTATLLADGRVLVAGGYMDDDVLAPAELYDPSTGTWTATGAMSAPRAEFTATLLPDGRVLVVGDSNVDAGPTATSELYDLSTGQWTLTGELTPRTQRSHGDAAGRWQGPCRRRYGRPGDRGRDSRSLCRDLRPDYRVVDRHRRHDLGPSMANRHAPARRDGVGGGRRR